VLVVGGGKIATRRILTLTNFEFEITVVAPNITNEIQQLADDGLLRIFSANLEMRIWTANFSLLRPRTKEK